MNPPDQFPTTLNQFVHRSAYTPGQLAALSGIPKMTIVNWLNGRVQRPRGWVRILQLAVAMRLTEDEADALLAAASHPTVAEIRLLAQDEAAQEAVAFLQHTAASVPPVAPFQAIPLPAYFVGRETELAALAAQLREGEQTAVYTLHGMAGVGKTALAAQLAYQLRSEFSDGVLWARLDSSDTMSILATFAAAYRQDVSQFHDVASRSRVVRDLLMAKRTLIVLDNAETSAQIEPLLPPTGRCAVLITTRRQDLAILAGSKRLEIRPFTPSPTTYRAFFTQFLGAERAQIEADELNQMADALGHLPLALVIAASRLAYEQGWQTASFQERVAQPQGRLPALRYESHSVQHTFQRSFELLDDAAQRLFATAGQLARQTVSLPTLAALAQLDDDMAQDGVRQLCGLSLLESENGRFHLHPLLHDFAQALPVDPPFAERMVAYWQRFVAEQGHDYAAIAWELGHVLLAVETAVRHERKRPLAQTLFDLMPFFIVRGDYDQAEHYLQVARPLFERKDDQTGLSVIYLGLGQLARHRQNLEKAIPLLQTGLALAQAQNERAKTARFLTELGISHNCLEQFDAGAQCLQTALPLARQEGVDENLLHLLEELGVVALIHGKATEAETYHREGLELATASGYHTHAIHFLKSIGALRHLAKDRQTARRLFEEGRALAQRHGYRKGKMTMETNLGVVAFFEGEMAQAEAHLVRGLAYAEAIHNYQAMGLILSNLGRLHWQNGRFAQARTYFHRLLTLSHQRNWTELAAEAQAALDSLSVPQPDTPAQHLKVFI